MACQANRAIRSILVLGGGIVALSAAAAFARALRGVRVELIETPIEPAALADRLAGTLPTVHRFHAALGLDEGDLVRRGIATHRLGSRFDLWSADGAPWYHVFGDHGLPVGAVAFVDLWTRAREEKRALPYHRYAAAAAMAEAGRFVHPSGDMQSRLSSFVYGLFLELDGYGDRLRAAADSAGVVRRPGRIDAVHRRPDGGVAELSLAGGETVEADLFVDASGPAASLLRAVGAEFEDWSAWLPCDRVVLERRPNGDGPMPVERLRADEGGWRWSAPLRGRSEEGRAFSSAFEGTDEAGDAAEIRPGRFVEPWTRNVLALGDAAAALDPLHACGLHLAHSGILRAVELLPGRDCHPVELAEYNRRTAEETLRVRDFLALHYLRSGRSDGAFWRAVSERPLPDSLALTVQQFEARGRIPFFEEEAFDKESWAQALIGLGLPPQRLNPLVRAVDSDRAAAGMERLAGEIDALVGRMPPYRDYLGRMASVPAAPAFSPPGR
jgi:tryptophan 7-halogenase